MAMNDTQATKRRLVEQILANPTYMPQSGMYRRLHDRLMTLAKDDLACLKMILDLKAGQDYCPACGGNGHTSEYDTCPDCKGSGHNS